MKENISQGSTNISRKEMEDAILATQVKHSYLETAVEVLNGAGFEFVGNNYWKHDGQDISFSEKPWDISYDESKIDTGLTLQSPAGDILHINISSMPHADGFLVALPFNTFQGRAIWCNFDYQIGSNDPLFCDSLRSGMAERLNKGLAELSFELGTTEDIEESVRNIADQILSSPV